MKYFSVFFRVCALLLALLMLSAALLSCGVSQDPAKPDEKTVIGTIDGREVYYDELYFLVCRYMESAKRAVGEDKEALQTELDRLFRENVLTSYAILRLCENHGLTLEDKEWKDKIDTEVKEYVRDDFEDDQALFDEELKAMGISKRYLRFVLGTDLLYNQLLYVYPEKGLVPSDEAELTERIRKEFIHVYHIVIFDDEGDDPVKNLEKIEAAQALLKSGKKDMYDLIHEGYTEDFSDVSASGEYIARGTMDEAYEKAAFSLRDGEVSDVIKTTGVNNNGQVVPCYYVIQRFGYDEAYEKYLNTHFSELANEYYGSVIATDLAEIEKTLSFEPNELYKSLDLTALAEPKASNNAVWIIILSSIGAILLIGGVVAIVSIKNKHKKKNINYKTGQPSLTKGESHERP